MGKLLNIWNFMGRHKYLITLAIFGVIVGFIDENSAIRRLGYKREIMQLNEEIEKYRAEYEESTEKLNELSSNPEMLEKIAREKYLMKKPNEDIYVFDR
jgi:cell division protein FtsB